MKKAIEKKQAATDNSVEATGSMIPPVHVPASSEVLDRFAEALSLQDEFKRVLAPMLDQMVGLVQLATAGSVESVERLLKQPGSFMGNLFRAQRGEIRAFLAGRALYEVMTGESKKDPLDWAKLLTELTRESIDTDEQSNRSAQGSILAIVQKMEAHGRGSAK